MEVIGISREELDFTDQELVLRYFRETKPDIVIHAGAVSDTGKCQKEPELSYKVNVLGTRWIAMACRELGARLVFCSSDQIYNGNSQSKALKDEAGTSPVNIYGKHKLEAEHWCRQLMPDSICLRLSWMFDLPDGRNKMNSNLLVNIMDAIRQKQPVYGAVYEYRGITYVKEVVARLEQVFGLPGGIYNFGSPNELNTYETMKEAIKLFNGDESLLIADRERFKDHPRNLCMNQDKAAFYGILFPGTAEGIRQCLKDYHILQ